MTFSFLGAYDPAYPRNAVLRLGLERNGVAVRECRLPASQKFPVRYPIGIGLCLASAAKRGVLFVPEFCQKDVPLARLLAAPAGRPVVFDPLASRFETKIIDWKRKPPHSWQARWNYFIDRMSFKLADLVLADTQAHKEYYCRHYLVPAGKVEVLPVGYDDRLFKPAASPAGRTKTFTVLFFGSFLPLHGAETIVRAAGIVAAEDRSVRFLFIGDGQTRRRVGEMAASLGLRNVDFIGWLPTAALPGRIAAADVCLGIFGQTEKAQRVVPHKIFQSLGMNRAVITARTPAVEEFFVHKKHLVLCAAPLAESLAGAILALKKNPELRAAMAVRGGALVREKYSPLALGRRLMEIVSSRFPLADRSRG